MPSDYNPNPPAPMTDEEMNKVTLPPDDWSDEFAGKIVVQDFIKASTYRNANHDWRWKNADELFLGWVDQKYWEGTRVPRSSLGILLAMQQIESLLPKVLSSIFAEDPWFDASPHPGSDPDEVKAAVEVILQQSEACNVREKMRRIIKSAFMYGNGIGELSWKYEEIERTKFTAQFIPKKRRVTHPTLGQITFPTGEFTRKVKEEKVSDLVNMPELNYVSIKDFYIDPNCPSPTIQDARYTLTRKYVSIDDILKFKGQEGFNVPDVLTLVKMATLKPTSFGDFTKQTTEVMRGGTWSPQVDQSVDPASRRLELLVYWTKERLVWMLNRDRVILNIANPFGFIPQFNVHYVDVLDRFYAVAVTDVVEGEQRLITSIINARVDELALSIHPTRIKRQGLSVPAYQFRRRPGQVIEAPDPKNDIVTEQVQNITEQAFVEVAAAERRAQQYTGVSELALMGTPGGSSGNSASRTATGIGAQVQAAFSRVQYLVENIESQFLEPMLYCWHDLNTKFIDPNQVIKILGDDNKEFQVDPLMVKNAHVQFTMRASSRMQSKSAMLQTLPLVLQTLLNPEFIQVAASGAQHMKVNFAEAWQMVMDATGYREKYKLFEPMTKEEIAAMNQPSPEQQMERQMQQDRLQGAAEVQDLKGTQSMLQEFVGKQFDSQMKKEDNQNKKELAAHGHASAMVQGDQSGKNAVQLAKSKPAPKPAAKK